MKPTVDVRGALRRTWAFVGALFGLLWLARSGQSEMVVFTAFAVFVSVATVWLRGQYADSLDGRQWVIPYRAGIWMTVGAVACLVIGFPDFVRPLVERLPFAIDRELFGIVGILVIYLVAGSALTQARQTRIGVVRGRRIHTGRWGFGLTVVGLLSAISGACMLSAGRLGLGWILIGSGVLALMPTGMALWSEQAIRWACARGAATGLLLGLGLGGAVLFAVAATGAGWVTHSTLMPAFLAILGLFVVAMVSTTQAGVVAVLAAVALMGVTPAQSSEQTWPDPVGGERKVLLALGDSYMSGEGASVYYKNTDDGGRNECRRAPTAWPALITQRAPKDPLQDTVVLDRETNELNALMTLACSGAKSGGVVEQVRAYQAAGAPPPSLVVLSLGGNDVGFSSIGVMCLAPGECETQVGIWSNALKVLPERLRPAYEAVDRAFPNTPVVIVPYPDPIKRDAKGCDQVTLSGGERRFIGEFVASLNGTIRQTAAHYGFHYVDTMPRALENAHAQLCDSANDGRPGVNFIGLRSVHGTAMQRFNPTKWVHSSLHPNERGHAAMSRVFQSWLARFPKGVPARVDEEERQPVTPDVPTCDSADDKSKRACAMPTGTVIGHESVPVAEAETPCDPLDDKAPTSCRKAAWHWAMRQVGGAMIRNGMWLLAPCSVAGAWMVAVAFFAYRRRVHASC